MRHRQVGGSQFFSRLILGPKWGSSRSKGYTWLLSFSVSLPTPERERRARSSWKVAVSKIRYLANHPPLPPPCLRRPLLKARDKLIVRRNLSHLGIIGKIRFQNALLHGRRDEVG